LQLSIFYEYQQFFQHRIRFSIQPPDYSDPWPTLARSSSFFLNNVVLQVGIHILIFFLANLAKGNMSFCHHLVSVICHPFTFHILIFSSENPQPNELKLDRKHLWKVFSKECTFCYDPLPNMAATGNSCLWLANILKSSPLKPLGQMNRNLVGSIYGRSLWRLFISSRSVNKHGYHRNLVGSIYGRSSMKIAHFVPIS
jgi:hypothetical protein